MVTTQYSTVSTKQTVSFTHYNLDDAGDANVSAPVVHWGPGPAHMVQHPDGHIADPQVCTEPDVILQNDAVVGVLLTQQGRPGYCYVPLCRDAQQG
jgi:hypothetical protein